MKAQPHSRTARKPRMDRTPLYGPAGAVVPGSSAHYHPAGRNVAPVPVYCLEWGDDAHTTMRVLDLVASTKRKLVVKRVKKENLTWHSDWRDSK